MKKNYFGYIAIVLLIQLVTSCENPMIFQTKVHENGNLDLSISRELEDTTINNPNIFGIGKNEGWEISYDTLDTDERKFHQHFKKTFNSYIDWNSELDNNEDSLFHIKASFEKQFKWFYTYIKYSQTIRPINRFQLLDFNDYLTEEDFTFIDRLPPFGKSISLADSLFLEHLNMKIYDGYSINSMLEREYGFVRDYIREAKLPSAWLDSLEAKKQLISESELLRQNMGDMNLSYKIMTELKIPVEEEVVMGYLSKNEDYKNYRRRLNFMSYANDGKYIFTIEMPWTITQSNADSLAANTLVWKPAVTKFLFRDYTMEAVSRKMNYWAYIVSFGFIIFTVSLFRRKRIK